MSLDWSNKFEQIFVHRDSLSSPVAQRFMQIAPDRVQVVDSEPPQLVRGTLSSSQFSQSKRRVFLTPFHGQFFKKCPGFHKGLACCNYFVLNLGFQCDMDCSYCYLQSFINSNYLTVYTNIDQALAELASFTHLKDQPVRVGTGEVIDSLSLDPITLYSRDLIHFFKDYPQWKLEFKTKSAQVDQFLDQEHGGNVIVSWSINPAAVIEKEEHGTASLQERLLAAQKCADKGFNLSFHIDPMIWHPGWQDSYAELVDQITQLFSPKQIPYLSVGALRYQPEQKNMMRERFGGSSWVNQAETFPGQDGKLRYDSDLRKQMFRFVMDRFQQHDPQWRIFMCMETPETWVDTFGKKPHRESSLQDLFQPIKKNLSQNKTVSPF
jgi:spore photoproduct lyase